MKSEKESKEHFFFFIRLIDTSHTMDDHWCSIFGLVLQTRVSPYGCLQMLGMKFAMEMEMEMKFYFAFYFYVPTLRNWPIYTYCTINKMFF